MGSIEYKHAFDRDGIVYVKGTIGGKRYRLSTGYKVSAHNMKRVDRQWREEIERILQGGEIKKGDDLKDGTNFEEFGLKSLQANSGNRKDSTNEDYARDFKNLIMPEFRGMNIEEIKPMEIKSWQTRMMAKGMGGNRIKYLRNIISGILFDATDNGIISQNPMEKVKTPPVVAKNIKPFNLEEMKIILDEAEGFLKNMLTVAFFTGVRSGELFALKWNNIDFEKKEIKVSLSLRKGRETSPKTKSSIRAVDMLPVVREALKAQYLDTGLRSEYVFLSKRNIPFKWGTSVANAHWYPLLDRCGLDHRDFYHTRHSFATLMLKQGEELMWVSKMMGHKDSSITLQRYAKFVEDKKTKRAKFLDNFGNKEENSQDERVS